MMLRTILLYENDRVLGTVLEQCLLDSYKGKISDSVYVFMSRILRVPVYDMY